MNNGSNMHSKPYPNTTSLHYTIRTDIADNIRNGLRQVWPQRADWSVRVGLKERPLGSETLERDVLQV